MTLDTADVWLLRGALIEAAAYLARQPDRKALFHAHDVRSVIEHLDRAAAAELFPQPCRKRAVRRSRK